MNSSIAQKFDDGKARKRKKLWVPLFPGNFFVNHVNTPENRFRIRNIPGAVRFIGLQGRAEPVPEKQIEYVRRFLDASIAVDS